MMDEGLLATPPATPGDREFRELADFAPVLIWRAGVDKQCDWFNKPWLAFTGRRLEQELGFGWADGVHPDDLDRCLGIYTSAFDAREPFSMEYRLRRHDGEYRWVLDNGAPYAREERFAGYFGSCTDITAHRDLQGRQQVMIRELNHRVKNMLSTVQSIAVQSFRNSVDDGATEAFTARLLALARTHDILMGEMWQSADLAEVVESAIAAYRGTLGTFELSGPSIRIAPQSALALGMALHELCTNAMRYGSLSVPTGRVAISWEQRDESVVLRWAELDGSVVIPAAYEGFGSRLLVRQLAREIRGTVDLTFPPEGAVCTITFPIALPAPDPVTFGYSP